MTQTRKYEVHRSASGFGVWDEETGRKVKGFSSLPIGRYEALAYLYHLNGWDFSRSKYMKENPWLANHKFEWEA